jgi:hypothetical protein
MPKFYVKVLPSGEDFAERLTEDFATVWDAQTAVNELQMAGHAAWIEDEAGIPVNDPNLSKPGPAAAYWAL